MTLVGKELKDALIARGLWADFVRRRTDIIRSEGTTSREAATRVLEDMFPEGVGMLRGRGRPKNAEAGHDGGGKTANQPKQSLADVRRTNRDAAATSSNGVGDHKSAKFAEHKVTKETFQGKSCAYSVALNWAYSNYRIVDISPNDAPSAVAWNLLLDMRESPSFKADVLRGWSNAMARKAEADEQKDRFDGEGEYDLLKTLADGEHGGEG